MKNSRFNYIVCVDGSDYIYNTLSKRLIMLDHFLTDIIQSSFKLNEIDELKCYHPTLFDALCNGSFLIPDNVNEIEKVREIMKEIDGDESHFYLIINPTMNCNFKCWYCYETHIKASKMSKKTLCNITKFVESLLKKNDKIKRFTIGWFGGEPLLYFQDIMLPIMENISIQCAEHGIYFSQNMTSNGFLIQEKMLTYFQKYNLSSFQITLDGSRDLHDSVRFVSKNRGSYDDIVDNIKLLARNSFPVTARINYTSSTLKNLEDIYLDFLDLDENTKNFLAISFHQVWQDDDRTLDDRVKELVLFFQSKGIKTIDGSIPDTLFGSCYADKKNHATINYDGNVFKCTARDFHSQNREGLLSEDGDIEWNEKYYNRIDIKLRNKPCLECKILPMCNGGCSQVAIESNGQDFCVYDYDEDKKRQIVQKKIESILNTEVKEKYA